MSEKIPNLENQPWEERLLSPEVERIFRGSEAEDRLLRGKYRNDFPLYDRHELVKELARWIGEMDEDERKAFEEDWQKKSPQERHASLCVYYPDEFMMEWEAWHDRQLKDKEYAEAPARYKTYAMGLVNDLYEEMVKEYPELVNLHHVSKFSLIKSIVLRFEEAAKDEEGNIVEELRLSEEDLAEARQNIEYFVESHLRRAAETERRLNRVKTPLGRLRGIFRRRGGDEDYWDED